jgi:alkanesulfonate monooxygenase SsuD/methylene tetrahydromethanopterin reductase-like flavin-dependent oxidoreductase (luciferase family)
MQFALNTPNFGCFSDARLMAEVAHEAEEAGWDGFFIWDHIGGDPK